MWAFRSYGPAGFVASPPSHHLPQQPEPNPDNPPSSQNPPLTSEPTFLPKPISNFQKPFQTYRKLIPDPLSFLKPQLESISSSLKTPPELISYSLKTHLLETTFLDYKSNTTRLQIETIFSCSPNSGFQP